MLRDLLQAPCIRLVYDAALTYKPRTGDGGHPGEAIDFYPWLTDACSGNFRGDPISGSICSCGLLGLSLWGSSLQCLGRLAPPEFRKLPNLLGDGSHIIRL